MLEEFSDKEGLKEELASFVIVAHDTTVRAIKEQHGKFVNWIDSLTTHDGMVLAEDGWTVLSQIERFMPRSTFVAELLTPYW